MAKTTDPRRPGGAPADAGLMLRFPSVARRIVHQHEQLDEFADLVNSSVDRGSLRSARQAFTSFSDALDAHITVEDQTVFPAIRGLRPSLAEQLSELIGAHEGFRHRMDELHESLARGSEEEFRVNFARFRDDFAAHEAHEEKLVATVTPS